VSLQGRVVAARRGPLLSRRHMVPHGPIMNLKTGECRSSVAASHLTCSMRTTLRTGRPTQTSVARCRNGRRLAYAYDIRRGAKRNRADHAAAAEGQ